MVDLSGMFRAGLEALGLASPSELASPEDLTAPPDQSGMISRPPETMLSLGGPYLKGLSVNDDSILAREGAQDLRLFDRLLDDDVAMSCLQQRRLAITSRDWEVTPGDDQDSRSVKAADEFRAMLKELGFDRVTANLHYAVWYGYAVAEGLYGTRQFEGRRIIWLNDIVVPDRRWFGFTFEGELRMLSPLAAFGGQALPANKFVSIRTGGTHDFAFYGLGLAHWAYWPVWFKRAATKFWALYLEKLSNPTAIGAFDEGDSEEDKNRLISSLVSIGRDSAVIVPKDVIDKIKFMEAQRSGAGTSSYREFLTENNEALMRIVLGQPGTSKATPGGIGSTQADVHADVKSEIVKADADLISEGLNTFGRWLTRWNHGEEVKPPSVYRVLDDAEDLNNVAERDSTLDGLGWRRTEESVEQIYGEGYERKPEPETPPPGALPGVAGRLPQERPPAANDDGEKPAAMRRLAGEFSAREPAPLYVQRKLLNTAEVEAWARAQGLDPVDDLHVTVLYSRTPVDWFSMGAAWDFDREGGMTVNAGGPRKVERFGEGEDGVIALEFLSDDLRYRHERMIEAGASHDHDGFRPHITIASSAEGVDLSKIEPFVGKLEFGPELFEEIEGLSDPLSMFGAAEEEAIESLTSALMDEANPVFAEFAAGIRESLGTARENAGGTLSLEGARVALLQAFERFDPRELAKLTGLSFLASRAAAEAGVEDKITAA